MSPDLYYQDYARNQVSHNAFFAAIVHSFNAKATQNAREALLTGGYEDGEIVILSSGYVASAIENTLPHVSLLAQLGSETRHMQEHLELAKQGCDKLIVYAPTEHESQQVMNVARRFDLRLAEKYHRLVIEHLEES
jgi:hypothetical protein